MKLRKKFIVLSYMRLKLGKNIGAEKRNRTNFYLRGGS